MDWFRPVNCTSDDSHAADGSALPLIVQNTKRRFNPERRIEAPPVSARRAPGRVPSEIEGRPELRPAEPLFRDAALVHTESATGTLAIAAVTSVPAWPAFAVVTRTSIRLHLQAIPITRRLLLARLSNRLVPPDCGIPART